MPEKQNQRSKLWGVSVLKPAQKYTAGTSMSVLQLLVLDLHSALAAEHDAHACTQRTRQQPHYHRNVETRVELRKQCQGKSFCIF